MRDLVLEAIQMRNAGKSRDEIHRHIWKGASALGLITSNGDQDAFEIRLVETGEIIFFNDKNGYSYRPTS